LARLIDARAAQWNTKYEGLERVQPLRPWHNAQDVHLERRVQVVQRRMRHLRACDRNGGWPPMMGVVRRSGVRAFAALVAAGAGDRAIQSLVPAEDPGYIATR
jgi:hypothetical protein